MMSEIKNKAVIAVLLAGELLSGKAFQRPENFRNELPGNASTAVSKLDDPIVGATIEAGVSASELRKALLDGSPTLAMVSTGEVQQDTVQLEKTSIKGLPSYLKASGYEISVPAQEADRIGQTWRNLADRDGKPGEIDKSTLTLPVSKLIAELKLSEVVDAKTQSLLTDPSREFPIVVGKLLITPPEAVEISGQMISRVSIMETATAAKVVGDLANLMVRDGGKFNRNTANEPTSFGSRFAVESAQIEQLTKERVALAGEIRSHVRGIKSLVGTTEFTAAWSAAFNGRAPAAQGVRESSVQSLRVTHSAESGR